MDVSAQTLHSFYETKTGQAVVSVLNKRVRAIWPSLDGLSLAGCGYPAPYMGYNEAQARYVFMNAGLGALPWGGGETAKNVAALIDPAMIPIGPERLDRVIMVHHFEHIRPLKENLQEIWHILRPNGRGIIIVPNRHGLWARTDWTPFGSGTPFSLRQILHYLQSSGFVVEQTQEALFTPPWKKEFLYKTAGFFEKTLRYCAPIVAGVHMIEVSKQISGGQGVRMTTSNLRTAGLFPAQAS